MSGRRIAATVLAATGGMVVAMLVSGSAHGLALLAYVLFLGALGLRILVGRLRVELPVAMQFERLLSHEPRSVEPVEQFETIGRTLSAAGWNEGGLHYRLRPLAREILAARLSRSHGVDLDNQPERARKLVGDGRAWELARPERERPEDSHAGGWSRRELEELLDELERI